MVRLLEPPAELRSYGTELVTWPERQRYGQSQVQLPDGGVLSTANAGGWNIWAAASGITDCHTVRWQQSWRHVGVAIALLVAALGAGWRWGVPAAAQGILAVMPADAETGVGEATLETLDEHLLHPSELSDEQQQQIARRFDDAAKRAATTTGPQPSYRLLSRDFSKALGPTPSRCRAATSC